MSVVYFALHGEDVGMYYNKLSGITDTSLTQKGIDQANKLSNSLKDIPFHFSITSRLTRTISYSQILLQKNKWIPDYIVDNSEFNERNYGKFEDKTLDQLLQEYDHKLVASCLHNINSIPPAGESMFQTYKRVTNFWRIELEPILDKDINILFTTHYTVLQCLLVYIDKLNIDKIPEQEIKYGNCIQMEF